MLLADVLEPAARAEAADESPDPAMRAASRWSVLVPFFNEREFLPRTLESLAAQTRAARVILIDNGSTDRSGAVARATADRLGLDYLLIEERRPGKVAALSAGLPEVKTPFVATCDADTWYPADYLVRAEEVLKRGRNVAAGAFFVTDRTDRTARERAARRIRATARLLRGQCHTGGAGQAFRTEALRAAGGFDPARWSFVLEDHEVIHRVLKHGGTIGYSGRLWCVPSARERDRRSIRWTLAERLLYAASAPLAGDWFFYRFLGPRLRARRLTSEKIRERRFQGVTSGAAYAVC